jgi:hypothetical protein
MDRSQPEYELVRLWLAANEGTATESELQKLSALIERDENARQCLVQLTRQQGWLFWNGVRAPGMARASLDANEQGLESLAASLKEALDKRGIYHDPNHKHVARFGELSTRAMAALTGLWSTRVPLQLYQIAFLAACLAVCVWLGLFDTKSQKVVASASPNELRAEIVDATFCVWNETNGTSPTLGEHFMEGDSVQLLEGVAKLHVAAGLSEATLELEGPAALILGKFGTSTLQYGKVAIKSSYGARNPFPLEASFGRVAAAPGSEIGVSEFGDSAEVHVFAGTATLQSPWLASAEGEFVTKTIRAGEMLKVNRTSSSSLQIVDGVADATQFASSHSMDASFLAVGLPYVREVKKAKPIAYWRFERSFDGQVPNEMGDGFVGNIVGNSRVVGPSGSRAIEFGLLPKAGSMRVNDSWDEVFAGDFSLEFWMKPSHYHVGTVLSFLGEFNSRRNANSHGVAVEVQGGWGQDATTCRVRFTHRAPLTIGVGGVSLFSAELYKPRRWQHVVTTRTGDSLAVYLDGKLEQTAEDPSTTPKGLRLIVGQLYSDTLARPFIGYLDEIAIYGRALRVDEIRNHYELIHAPVPPQPGAAGNYPKQRQI